MEKIMQSITPQRIDLNVSSGSLAAAGMMGWKDSPGFSGGTHFLEERLVRFRSSI